MKKIVTLLFLVVTVASFSSCKKCYDCVHPDGAMGGYPDREICGKGLIGKAAVEADRSNLVYEGYSCR